MTILTAAVSLLRLPYYQVPAGAAVSYALGGVALMAGDLLVSGALFLGLSLPIFRRFGRPEGDRRLSAGAILAEALLLFVAIVWGVSMWYPAVVSEPVLIPTWGVPAGVVIALLATLVVLGARSLGKPGSRLKLAAMLLLVGLVIPGGPGLRARFEGAWGSAPSIVVLGIDSLSHADDLDPFREWAREDGGTWYERAVAPGLLTNAVWASILTGQPVRTHGVFHTFQPFPGPGAATFLRAARGRGFRTVSMFPDQTTCAVGSEAGFDRDRSGPIGWRQLLLPIVANSSILVPLTRPLFPDVWPSPLASNQAGTYTYNVGRDIRSIFSAGGGPHPTLVAAHLTYLHLPAYPRSVDLSWDELTRVALTPARRVRDRSLDWQDSDRPDDPVPLRRWKLARLGAAIRGEARTARYVANGGRLVLFSDHGDRVGVTSQTFTDPRYHHVLLTTFGLGARTPADPVSLIDIASLLGFSEHRAEPAVEYALTPPELWTALVRTARTRWSGAVDLDAEILARVFEGLRHHVPWPVAVQAGALTPQSPATGSGRE